MASVLDAQGLVKDNEILTVYYPHTNSAMVFRVIGRYNKHTTIDYGLAPIDSGDTVSSLDSGVATVAADGRMPARSFVEGQKFDLADCYDTGDMWYLPYTWNDRIFHVKAQVKPAFIRLDLQIPQNVNQSRFQNGKVIGGVGTGTGLGYAFGELETVHLPDIHYGYCFANDTNVAVPMTARFVYGEYLVKIPSQAELIAAVLNKQIQSHWVTMPVTTADSQIDQSLTRAWGFKGFPILPPNYRERAMETYREILNSRDVQAKGVLI